MGGLCWLRSQSIVRSSSARRRKVNSCTLSERSLSARLDTYAITLSDHSMLCLDSRHIPVVCVVPAVCSHVHGAGEPEDASQRQRRQAQSPGRVRVASTGVGTTAASCYIPVPYSMRCTLGTMCSQRRHVTAFGGCVGARCVRVAGDRAAARVVP